ncbi:MAG: hypothetical protein VX112_05280 [Pseudomonadota bacterium]|nr:hypothetical protein [Pseudomonadota bacterium]
MKRFEFSLTGTLMRTIIYTIGHIGIAIMCIITITGSDIRLATIDAIIEPLINAVWYFVLDYLWTKYVTNNKSIPET